MGYRVKLISGNPPHPTGTAIFEDDGIKMELTTKWKDISRKTKKLEYLESINFVMVEETAEVSVEEKVDKLNAEDPQIIDIISLLKKRVKQVDIAEKIGVDKEFVSRVKKEFVKV